MNSFESQGFKIAFDDYSAGDPIILLLGFAADRPNNGHLTVWTRPLRNAGFRITTPGARARGSSDKQTDPKHNAPPGVPGYSPVSRITGDFSKRAVPGFLDYR